MVFLDPSLIKIVLCSNSQSESVAFFTSLSHPVPVAMVCFAIVIVVAFVVVVGFVVMVMWFDIIVYIYYKNIDSNKKYTQERKLTNVMSDGQKYEYGILVVLHFLSLSMPSTGLYYSTLNYNNC